MPSSAGIGAPAWVDTGRSGRFGRAPGPTGGSPSTSQDVTSSQLMQQTMAGWSAGDFPEDGLDPLAETIIADDVVVRQLVRDLITGPVDDPSVLGLFIPVPVEIIREFERDFPIVRAVRLRNDSPPHISLLIMDDGVRPSDSLQVAVTEVAARHRPFTVHLRGTDYFDSDDSSVMYVHAVSPELDDLHADLQATAEQYGHRASRDFDEYVPHMTLQYLSPDVRVQQMCVDYCFQVDRFELWGAGSPVLFRLGEVNPVVAEGAVVDEDDGPAVEESSGAGAVAGYTQPLGAGDNDSFRPAKKRSGPTFGK